MKTTVPRNVRLVDPTGDDPGISRLTLAPRPNGLRGRRLGLLDNSKPNSQPILRAIARLLDEESGLADIFYVRKHSSGLPPRPEVLADLHRHTDLVVTGIGD